MPPEPGPFTIDAMPFLSTREQRAALLILALGAALVYVLWPYFSGLLGAPVLYVVFGRFHQRLAAKIGAGWAALVVIVIAAILIALPIVGAVTLVANEATGWAEALRQSELLSRLSTLQIGTIKIGEQLKEFSSNLLSFLGGSALGIVGTGAKLLIQFTITFFGLYYLLLDPGASRRILESFIPFSPENRARLLDAFRGVTVSMLIGTFAVAIAQGLILGLTFWMLGFPSPAFWGVVTIVLSVLPVVGGGLVWGPGAAYLFIQGRVGAAILLVIIGALIIGNVDTLVRPFVFQRYAKLHPFITIIGAFAFVPHMGLLGLLVGPLAISYFFALVQMYREEYLKPA
jgi:predicted PurR-regulated permease PerM